MYLSAVGKIRMRESITPYADSASGRADDSRTGLDDVPTAYDEEEGVEMSIELDYGSCGMESRRRRCRCHRWRSKRSQRNRSRHRRSRHLQVSHVLLIHVPSVI
ncbi:hypothetical protein M9H77_03595 [Catharanthus roseus]|uniref:Uncharacterized protein n=1 Tax=Catharanthus roseus TaxID=4058 RepID=A0ACC0CBV7_CATRO|nr:hypothetical protein M9H77_03595 [Catharanthus roseus]